LGANGTAHELGNLLKSIEYWRSKLKGMTVAMFGTFEFRKHVSGCMLEVVWGLEIGEGEFST